MCVVFGSLTLHKAVSKRLLGGVGFEELSECLEAVSEAYLEF